MQDSAPGVSEFGPDGNMPASKWTRMKSSGRSGYTKNGVSRRWTSFRLDVRQVGPDEHASTSQRRIMARPELPDPLLAEQCFGRDDEER